MVTLRFGELHDDLTEALNELVKKVDITQKSGKIVLTLGIKAGKGGQIEISDDLKLTLPKLEKATSILFATPEGNLQRQDPRQKTFEGIRSVDQEAEAQRTVVRTGTDDAAPAPLAVRAAT
ncbi:hypothetical protein M0D69_13770 [Caballeronia sp. SEWSISQ10-4 2]|uniref:hypothetical protein n=1 Tax=Caballeronia sp. SEWSISQ10-4 2 TaxID=2937438 RepID=UPI002650824C|nr:hypothetical protein [Caballeronia sp. SEWSISQ10-4 2]MDN7179061.1 hypothetical protein [Caballeronia sp. SEWSISQ10-4 2]